MSQPFARHDGPLSIEFEQHGIWIVATIWIGGKPMHELGRVLAALAGPPESAAYGGWVEAMGTIAGRFAEQALAGTDAKLLGYSILAPLPPGRNIPRETDP